MAGSFLVEYKSPNLYLQRRPIPWTILILPYLPIISSHVKGSHLSYEDRILIQIRLKSRCSIRAIAREIGCSPSTVSNEISRGSVALYHGRVTCYKASVGQQTYENHRKNSCRHYEYLSKSAFLDYVFKHFTEDGWSLDACVGRALLAGSFTQEQVVCTKTLYHYVDLGLLRIKIIPCLKN